MAGKPIKLDEETYARLDTYRDTDRGKVSFNNAVKSLLDYREAVINILEVLEGD